MYRNFPVLESERTIISAPRYNRVRLALALLENPARLDLTGIHDLQLVLNDDAWLCIDTGLGNLPVLAWKAFDTAHRRGLHEPISCRVDYYNLHAELIKGRVLDIMDRLLVARLNHHRRQKPLGQIRPFPTGRSPRRHSFR
jgi:hypothetical protein